MQDFQEIVVEFQLNDKSIKETLLLEFSELETIESNAFTGAEILTIILPASIVLIDKLLNFYLKNKEVIKGTIKIGKDEINLSGYSTEDIQELTKDGSLEKLYKLISKDKQLSGAKKSN